MSSRPLAIMTFLLVSLLTYSPAEASISSVVKNNDLQFGFFVSLGSSGSVTVSPGGARGGSGGVRILNGGTVAAASFTVSGTNHSRYTITLPANNTVFMSHGGQLLALTNFSCSVPLTGYLSGKTPMIFTVGGTATVVPNPVPGSYTGTFHVTVQ